MQLISPEKASHYYRATDQGIVSYYEMRGKNGKMRAPTIADAREQGLLVSISRIAGMLPKPRLNAWLQSQAIISALTLPRAIESLDSYKLRLEQAQPRPKTLLEWCYINPPKYLEDIDAFAKRVVEDMEAQSQKAMDFGSRIHAQIESELLIPIKGPELCPPDLNDFVAHVRNWLGTHVSKVIAVEKIVGDPMLGIGGKLDLLCHLNMPGSPLAVVDFKTQAIKNGSATYYPEYPLQLAAYAQCVKQQGAYEIWPTLVSVVIGSKQPEPVHFKAWENPEHYWEMFLHCLEIFCYVNDYRPGQT